MLQPGAADLTNYLAAEIAVVAPDGLIVNVNRKWRETATAGEFAVRSGGWNYIAECEAAAARGCNDASLVLTGLREVLSGQRDLFTGTYLCPINDTAHWFEVSITFVPLDDVRHAAVMHVDVTPLQSDTLTGLPNRAMFEAQFATNLAAAERDGLRTGVVFVDIDDLKEINDRHGHVAGDNAVKEVAAAVVALAGPGPLVARLGGDEFGVVLPVGRGALAPQLEAAVDTGIVTTTRIDGAVSAVRASAGAAYYPADGTSQTALLSVADHAMYANKRRARA